MKKRHLASLAPVLGLAACVGAFAPTAATTVRDARLLYVASPGVLGQVEHGGVGILVFDITNNHRFVRRIPTWPEDRGPVERVKGIAASVRTRTLCLSTPSRVACFDLLTDRKIWEREYEGGADRLALTPDGKTLYVPSYKGPHWLVVDARSGEVMKKLVVNAGAHNTIVSLDGERAYLAGLQSPWLYVVDTSRREIERKVGPFDNFIRPFTVNAAGSLCFVNVNDLLGFEVGDLNSGRMLHRVEIEGFSKGPVARHACPSHGIGLTPDEKELWVCDSFNERVHVFDATTMPPKQVASIKLRDQPGWVTFGIDGRFAYPSTGEIIEVASKKIVTTLQDEKGRPVHSEKLLEIDWADGQPVRAGDQFGLGRTSSEPPR